MELGVLLWLKWHRRTRDRLISALTDCPLRVAMTKQIWGLINTIPQDTAAAWHSCTGVSVNSITVMRQSVYAFWNKMAWPWLKNWLFIDFCFWNYKINVCLNEMCVCWSFNFRNFNLNVNQRTNVDRIQVLISKCLMMSNLIHNI